MKRRFLSINFHKDTVERFKGFCAKAGGSYTDTLERMMDFFDTYQLSPMTDLGPNMRGMEANIKKRINALVSIVKDIEKRQTKPTTIMLQRLFEETSKIEKENEEEFDFGTPKLLTENEELEYYKNAYYKNQETYNDLKHDTKRLLKKVKYVKSNFGIGHYRLEITKEDLKQLKEKL